MAYKAWWGYKGTMTQRNGVLNIMVKYNVNYILKKGHYAKEEIMYDVMAEFIKSKGLEPKPRSKDIGNLHALIAVNCYNAHMVQENFTDFIKHIKTLKQPIL